MKTFNELISSLKKKQKPIKKWYQLNVDKIFKNKKAYNRKTKHKKVEEC